MKKKPNGKVKAAGIVLFTSEPNKQFLLMKHANRWDLPKGHCEPNETYLETALRETEEETGISPSTITIDADFVFVLEYPVTYRRWGDEVFNKKVKYFLGHIKKRPKLKLTEHEGAQWFDWQPPHAIQEQTIDPLLEAIAAHFQAEAGEKKQSLGQTTQPFRNFPVE
ncbi:MAG: NUDIX domain-containing protein [Pirellulaceae bacterium]